MTFKKKILLSLLICAFLSFLFVLSIGATDYNTTVPINTYQTAEGDTSVRIYDENNNPLIWYVSDSANNIISSIKTTDAFGTSTNGENLKSSEFTKNDIVVANFIGTGYTTVAQLSGGSAKLQYVYFPKTVTYVKRYENNTKLLYAEFEDRSDIENDTLTVDEYLFKACSSLQTAIMPRSLKKFPNYCFSGCSSLIKIFADQDTNKNLYIDSVGKEAFKNCKNLNFDKVILTSSFNGEIPYAAFYMVHINEVDCEDGANVTGIGKAAFDFNDDNTSTLTSVTLKGTSNLTSVGDEAFRNNKKLITINLPSTTVNFGFNCFKNCNALTKIFENQDDNTVLYISSLTDSNIGNEFYGCNSLYFKEIVFTKDFNGVIPIACFRGMKFGKVSAEKGANITEIKNDAFSNQDNKNPHLTSVNLGNSYTVIKGAAFKSCGKLQEFYISDKVTSIESEAFNSTPSKMIFYYTGTIDAFNAITKGSSNAAITNITEANKIDYSAANGQIALETALDAVSGVYLVYNYSACKAYKDTSSSQHENLVSEMVYTNGFDKAGSKNIKCDYCGYENNEALDPIFTVLGYSIIDNNVYVGFQISTDAMNEYNTANNCTVRYGVFVANGNIAFTSDGAISGDTKAIWAEINPESQFTKYGITITGLNNDSYKAEALAYGSYTIDSDNNVRIIQKDGVNYDGAAATVSGNGVTVATTSVNTITYNKINELISGENGGPVQEAALPVNKYYACLCA